MKTEVAKRALTPAERFTNKVKQEFASKTGTPELTNSQKRLIQNYFIKTDLALQVAEDARLRKNEKYRDNVPVTWENININNLALDVVACARIGYDPALPNHINIIPYKNNKTGKYDIGFMEGYRGKEIKAMKYGFRPPTDVIVELVFENDSFTPIKKDRDNPVESYIFKVAEDPFDRGEIKGGFYYHRYEDESRNKLVVFTKQDIDKRKPTYASAEFWGGEKDEYVNGKKTGKKVHVEGWYKEMAWKTIARAAYNDITLDGEKIDENFMRLMENEDTTEDSVAIDISENANKQVISVNEYAEPEEEQEPEEKREPEKKAETKKQEPLQQTLPNPEF